MQHTCNKSKSIVKNGKLLTGCRLCLPTLTHLSADYSAKYNRNRSRDNHRADIVQRYDGDRISKEYVTLYEDKARKDLGDEAVNNILRGTTNGRD